MKFELENASPAQVHIHLETLPLRFQMICMAYWVQDPAWALLLLEAPNLKLLEKRFFVRAEDAEELEACLRNVAEMEQLEDANSCAFWANICDAFTERFPHAEISGWAHDLRQRGQKRLDDDRAFLQPDPEIPWPASIDVLVRDHRKIVPCALELVMIRYRDTGEGNSYYLQADLTEFYEDTNKVPV